MVAHYGFANLACSRTRVLCATRSIQVYACFAKTWFLHLIFVYDVIIKKDFLGICCWMWQRSLPTLELKYQGRIYSQRTQPRTHAEIMRASTQKKYYY
jgi:hypothetical protein